MSPVSVPTQKYPVSEQDAAEIEKRFTYHAPKENQPERYNYLRSDLAKNLAFFILQQTPKSREQSLALTHLEESIFWANAAIARNE